VLDADSCEAPRMVDDRRSAKRAGRREQEKERRWWGPHTEKKKMSLTAAAAGSRWEAARVRDIGPNGPNRLGSVVFLFFF
jgi:hypothetical protein